MLRSLALTAVLAGCLDAPAEATLEAEVIGGTALVTTDAVVAIELDGAMHCSGVLISPHVVLTAAHCIPMTIDGLSVAAGWSLTAPTLDVPAVAAKIHPDYADGQNDIGVIALAYAMPVPPLPLATSTVIGRLSVGDPVTIAGFGRDAQGAAGMKQSGTATIASIAAATIELAPSPSITCDGDSGGPVLVPLAGGGSAVAGINALSNCRDTAVAQRADLFAASFIEPYVAAAESHEICAGDDCHRVTGGCSTGGSPSALVALAFLGISRRRFSPPRKDQPCSPPA